MAYIIAELRDRLMRLGGNLGQTSNTISHLNLVAKTDDELAFKEELAEVQPLIDQLYQKIAELESSGTIQRLFK